MTQPFDTEYQQLMQSIAEKSSRFLSTLHLKKESIPDIFQQYVDFIYDMQNFMTHLLKDPEKLWKSQFAYWQAAIALTNNQMLDWFQGKSTEIGDKRFSDKAWQAYPFFSLLSRYHILAEEHITALLQEIEYKDKKTARKVQFFAKQFLDALAPSNFLSTNPQVLHETLQSQGKNLLRGMEQFIRDIEHDPARFMVKMSDTEFFSPGKNLAVTPGKVVFRNDLMELIQYAPQTKKVRAIPLLFIPPWINKYYILDLRPENSLIHWLVNQGITVFMISWVNPDNRHAHKDLSDYIEEGPKTAIRLMQKQLQVEKVNVVGFCIGGTALACLLAYYTAIKENPIQSATFLASLIDFAEPGDIGVFIDEQQIRNLEKNMSKKGYLEGSFMTNTFNSLRANDLVWSFFIKNYLSGQKAMPFDILYWNADATNMAAKMHSEYLRAMYLHNRLIQGQYSLFNEKLDVHAIKTPSFFVSTKKDHIAPWESTYNGFAAFQGKKHFLLGESGHIAGIINPPSADKYGYYVHKKAEKTAKDWFTKAQYHEGSWWPYWYQWLSSQSGAEITSPNFKKLPFKPLMDAPGSYVLKKAKDNDRTDQQAL